jgi:hypothetical protein
MYTIKMEWIWIITVLIVPVGIIYGSLWIIFRRWEYKDELKKYYEKRTNIQRG